MLIVTTHVVPSVEMAKSVSLHWMLTVFAVLVADPFLSRNWRTTVVPSGLVAEVLGRGVLDTGRVVVVDVEDVVGRLSDAPSRRRGGSRRAGARSPSRTRTCGRSARSACRRRTRSPRSSRARPRTALQVVPRSYTGASEAPPAARDRGGLPRPVDPVGRVVRPLEHREVGPGPAVRRRRTRWCRRRRRSEHRSAVISRSSGKKNQLACPRWLLVEREHGCHRVVVVHLGGVGLAEVGEAVAEREGLLGAQPSCCRYPWTVPSLS